MTRLRFSLAQSMAIVLYLGFGFAALRNADEFWASATFTLALFTISAALVVAIARKGRVRLTWVGFAVFGWAYLLVTLLRLRSDGRFGLPRTERPQLLIEWGIARLQPYIKPGPGLPLDLLMRYEQVSYSLGIMLFGLVGAVLGHLLAVKDERPGP